MVEGPAKRQRVDENSEPNRQSVTDEQKAIVEKNRQVALARRSAQTEQRIRQNREAALERRRQRLELLKGSQECQDVLQNISNQSGEDLQQPTSKEDDAGKQEVLQNISKEKAQFNQSGEDLQHPTSKEDEDRQEHALLNISQKQAEVNQSGEEISQQDAATLAMAQDHQPTHESSAVEDMEESSECAFELTSGSESSLSSRESSLSSSESSSSESSGEEEDKEEDQDHQEILATAKTEDLEEDLVEQEEDEGPVDLKICREARPRGEPECCTQRWAPVELQGLSTGEVPAAKTRERSAKQALVAKLLCRWWYVLPDWPPKDFDYTAALAEAGFRAVSVEEFEQEAELEGNLRKVFALPNGYPGLYRDEQGCLIDVRPVKGRPSYDQLMLRSKSELHKLLVLAYTRQLEVLESRARSNDLETLRQQLRQELAQAKNNVFNFFKHPQVQSA